MEFHLLSFEGPDAYARVGGLATRIEGLAEALVSLGFETHLWFVGAPDGEGHEQRGLLHLHRWCQWVSAHHPRDVYDGEWGKVADFSASLPPYLVNHFLSPTLRRGGHAVVLAEEWQTVGAVLRLDELLRAAGLRDRVSMLWNANNIFGFEYIPWDELAEAALITTVSRYMKHRMREWGVDALAISNGLSPDAYEPPRRGPVQEMRRRLRDRTVLTKMARWDPGKNWIETVRIAAEMKRQHWNPLLIARGGSEPHGEEVLRAAAELGLRIVERRATRAGAEGLLEVLRATGDADLVNLTSYVDPDGRRTLFRGSDAVLANSGHEPFGLVGLETMAVGGVAVTGCSGEDYAVPGQNAIVLETGDPLEFLGFFRRMRGRPAEAHALRRAGQSTARRYAWTEIAERVLMPRVEPRHEDAMRAVPRPSRARRLRAVERAAG